MKFYMIQDLNSGLWYRNYEGVWGEQQDASVWTHIDEPRGVPAAMDNIEACNAWRLQSQPCDPVIRIIDTEALKVLRDLFAIRDLGEFIEIIDDGELWQEGDTKRWCDAVDRARNLLKEHT